MEQREELNLIESSAAIHTFFVPKCLCIIRYAASLTMSIPYISLITLLTYVYIQHVAFRSTFQEFFVVLGKYDHVKLLRVAKDTDR